MQVEGAKRPFTVQEYHLMVEAGILTEDDRVELVYGEIIEMSPIGNRYMACVNRLTMLLTSKLAASAIVSIQNSVRIGAHSEPQPDVTLLRPQNDFYAQSGITPQEVLLLIEVADTTLNYDRKVKLPLYAEAGIPEVWIVNLRDDYVEVYKQPANGLYQKEENFQRDTTLSASQLSLSIAVREMLG